MQPDPAATVAVPLAAPVGPLTPLVAQLLLTAGVIGLLVRLLKADRVPPPLDRIPPKWRAVLAVVLGQAAGVVEAVLAGTPWRDAAMKGVLAAGLAVLAHDAIFEALLKGWEPLRQKTATTLPAGNTQEPPHP